MRYILYTDGSCLSNPDGPGGYAAVLIQDNKEIQRISGGNPSTTNNRMEITAVMEGLRMVPEGAEVLLKSDSEYVIKTIQGVYSAGKNADLWQQLRREIKNRHITCEWVRGHNGNVWNELCDELAGEAAVNSARGCGGGNRPDFAVKTGGHGRTDRESGCFPSPAVYAGRICLKATGKTYEVKQSTLSIHRRGAWVGMNATAF